MSRNTNQAKALVDAWFIFLRYKWRFVFPLFVVSAAVLALSLLLPRKYHAEAVFDRRTDQILASIMNGSVIKTKYSKDVSIREEMTNGVVLDKAIEDIKPFVAARVAAGGPDTNLTELRYDMSRKLQIRFEISTQQHERVSVTYIGHDPEISRRVINRLVYNYIEQARVDIAHGMEKAQGFFYDEVDRTRVKIESLENQKLTYEIKYAELLPNSPNSINVVQGQVEERIADLTRKITMAKAYVLNCEEMLASTSQTVNSLVKERNPELIRLEDKSRDLTNQYRTAVVINKMTERHPDVMDLKIQINEIQAKIQATDTEVVTRKTVANNGRFEEMKLTLNSAQAQQASLESELVQVTDRRIALTAKSADIFPIRSEYRKIIRQMDQLQREMQFWEENLRRIQMARSAENGNRGVQLTFIRPCRQLTVPVAPSMFQIVLSAIGLGLIAGSVSLLFAHRMDETFHDGEQLSNTLQLPLLGEVSEIVSVQHRRMRKIRNMVVYPLNAVAMTAVLGALVSVLYLNLKSPDTQEMVQEEAMPWVQPTVNEQPTAIGKIENRQADTE
ncbi:MAG: hypothetical protein JKX85_15550 [Phycisphaeraceae bacterium]|nr:hypothetical protein [Phycisphaeraceae bacterium]